MEASYRCYFITLLIFIWKNSNQLSQELFPRENKLLLAPNTLMGYVVSEFSGISVLFLALTVCSMFCVSCLS